MLEILKMNIYTIVSRKNKDAFKKSRNIIEILEGNNFKIIKKVWPKSVEEKSGLIVFLQNQIKSMKGSDVIVFDTSQYSTVVAFLSAIALLSNKFVLLLHERNFKHGVLNFFRNLDFPNFSLQKYSGQDELNLVLRTYLNGLKRKLNKRFILTISNEIERYLDWVSEEWGINKAEIVRRAILNSIRKDEEYQKSTKN